MLIMMYKVLTFNSVDKMLIQVKATELHFPLLLFIYVVEGDSNFRARL